MLRAIPIVAALSLGACSTIVEGTTQDIKVATDPAGASCDLKRAGETLGKVAPTPGQVNVRKTHADITVTCSKEGFKDASYVNRSDVAAATFGNIIAGGVIGAVVDASTGASLKYESNVTLKLEPTSE